MKSDETSRVDTEDAKERFGTKAVLATDGDDGREDARLTERAEQVAARFTGNSLSPFAVAAGVRGLEFLTAATTGFGVYFAYVVPMDGMQLRYAVAIALISLLAVLAAQMADGYQMSALRRPLRSVGRVLIGWTALFALLSLAAFFARVSEDYSRVWYGSWFLTGMLGILVMRSVVSAVVRRWTRDGRLERRAVIVGGGNAAADLILALEAQEDSDIRICGIFDDRQGDRSPPIVSGYPKLGTVSQLVEFGRRARVDMLIFSLPLTAEKRVLQLLKKVWVLPVDIRLSAHTNQLRFRPRSYSYVGQVPFLDVFDKPIADWDGVMKRGLDLGATVCALVLLSPLMLLTAIAVKLDSPGPVFFRQKRYGFNNEIIDVWKFRSLRAEMSDPEAKTMVTKTDKRVTRVGRIIRKTSIDELPQLFNVLRGDLSLVGPRPHVMNAYTGDRLYDEVVDGYFGRHRVKPGVTGWAQVNGWRGEVDVDEKLHRRVEHDLYYIENWSLLFDLYILAITPLKLLDTRNAY